jgi:hypothetical protein
MPTVRDAAMKMPDSTFDFESESITQRPEYPPRPVGLAIQLRNEPDEYCAWGHPSGNGIYVLGRGGKLRKVEGDPKRRATMKLRDANRGTVLGYSSAHFDVDVAEVHLGLKPPQWDRSHDGLFARFLSDPHAPDLKLKNSAERVLDEPPEERDAVYDWLAERGWIQGPRKKDGVLKYPKNAGGMICKAPGDLVALYAIGDLGRTRRLFKRDMAYVEKWGMLDAYRREQRVAPILLANERAGMRVDLPRLEADLKLYDKAVAKCEAWLRKRLGAPPSINWDSDDEVAVALRKSGIVKRFPKTPTGKDSVAKGNLTKEFFSDPDVYLALCWRNLTTYVINQNMRPWFEQAQASGGFIYTSWNQVRGDKEPGMPGGGGARSGRITCSKWGNIIKGVTDGKNPDYREPDDTRIRKKIGLPAIPLARFYCLPDEGHLFVHNDWNQQELRLVAHYEDGALAEAYRNDPSLTDPTAKKVDIHQFVTDLIFKVTSKQFKRDTIKHVDFRTVYGGGESGLVVHPFLRFDKVYGCDSGCPHKSCAARKAAHEVLSSWKRALPDVVELDRFLKDRFYAGDHIRTYGGRVYFCKPPAVAKKGPRKGQLIHFEYTALNYLIQPSGADLIKMAIINYDEHPKRRGRLLSIVHDEMNASTERKHAPAELKVIKECMEAIKLEVPWRTDGDLRERWGGEKVAS